MRVSLLKVDPSLKLSDTIVQVLVSEIDESPHFIHSHSFKYKVPSGMDTNNRSFGEITVYPYKDVASVGISFAFDLERCCNKECKKDDKVGCPFILANTNRLLVANIFHTKPKTQALQEFGAALFKALFSGYAGQLLQKTKPTHRNGGVFLQLNDNDDLDAIPWEYANDRATLLVHQRIFARVQAPLLELSQASVPKTPLRIVAVVPDPIILPNESGASLPNLHLGEQFQNFINRFTKNKKRVKLERVFPPTVSQVGALLDTENAMSTVLHFMGHCGQDGDSRALIFEHGETSKPEYVNASQLGSVLKNVRLAFLSACNSRDVARVLVEYGVRYTIGSDCPIPDDLARKFEFEFYKFLANGSTIEMAMYQARASFLVGDETRQSTYFAGTMVLYMATIGENDSAFKCEEGSPDVQLHMPPNNLIMSTASEFRGCQKELAELYSQLRGMVFKGHTSHIYTIKGVGSQGFVEEAMRRMAHLFPGGIFAWRFDKEKTAILDYFQGLVEVLFSRDIWTQLTEQHDSNVEKLGSAIIRRFQTGNHATCLLILDHADILDLGRKEKNMHAVKLANWLENVTSVRDTIKILLSSNELLDWLKGGLMRLNDSGDIDKERGLVSTWDMKKSIHEYFEYYSRRINHSQGFQGKNCFYGVPEENRAFVNRQFIQEMKDALSGGCRILALRGLGGMGKSQLMLRYCYLNEAAYDLIFWLTVDNWNTAVQSYRQLADYLGLDEKIIKEKDSEQKVIRWVLDWFQERKKWLLLLDNADDDMGKRIFELLPRKGGDIIITTRQFISSTRATVIQVDKMQEQEALHLLYGVDSIDQKNTKFNYAKEIITELDCMPLAINLAHAYVKRIQTSFKDYLGQFKEQKKRVKLLEYRDKNDSDQYEYTVATVWQLSFERIRAVNSTSVQVLEACAFLHPKDIPTHLFKKQYSALELISSFSAVPPNEQDSEVFSHIIGEAITMLVEFSFITQITKEIEDDDEENPASDLLTIHRLVQKVIYDMMDDERRLYWAHNLATALNKDAYFSYEAIYVLPTQRIMDTYIFHIYHFINLLGDLSQKPLISKDFSLLLVRVVWYLLEHGTYFGIDKLVQISDQVSEAAYREDHSQFGTSLMNHAVLYLHQGKYNKAELLFKQSLAIFKKSLGLEHSDTAWSLQNLANLYFNQGKYDEAEPLYNQSLVIFEKLLGSEHLFTAQALNNLAELYRSQSKYDKAELLYKQSLAIREKFLGSEHPDTAASLQNLAILYFNQGKYNKAELLYKWSLVIYKKLLRSEHPSTAMALNNLAVLYYCQSKYNEAELLYKQSLAIRKKSLGSEHPNTAQSLQNLANLYFGQCNYDKAKSMYKLSLVIYEKSLGSEHPSTALALNNLAVLYWCQSKYNKAEPLYKWSLVIREKLLGSEHPDTAQSLQNLALLYFSRGKYDEAELLYKQSLAIYEKSLGSEHPDTAVLLQNLALLYFNWGKYNEAELLYKRALVIFEKSLGSEHSNTTTSLQNLANLYFDQGKYDKAELLYKRSLAIRKKSLGSEH